jgi:hypothetical protein
VPYLKFSRDKRGYEHFFLIEPPSSGRDRGKARSRVLFWFRTPPNVKVGRVPFSDDVRQLVEAQNPGVTFDWARILATPIPAPDADHWRERRRVEKAARRAAKEDDVVEAETAVDEAEAQPIAAALEATSAAEDVEAITETIEAAATESPTSDPVPAGPVEQRRRRRRRRGGRGRHVPQVPVQPGSESVGEITPAQHDAASTRERPPSDEV